MHLRPGKGAGGEDCECHNRGVEITERFRCFRCSLDRAGGAQIINPGQHQGDRKADCGHGEQRLHGARGGSVSVEKQVGYL
jgi:hypothetical protein